MLAAVTAPPESRCSLHPETPATLLCHRCGAFICDEDHRRIDPHVYCPSCAVRPDVDYLEAFRLKHWGKRDTWAWLFGFGVLPSTSLAFLELAAEDYVSSVTALYGAVVQAFYFLGHRWARLALFVFPLLAAVSAMLGPVPSSALTAVFPLLIMLSVFHDTRNRLFFRVDVSRRELRRAWNLYANNTAARAGFILSLLGIVPGFSVIGLVLSIVGLTRVNPTASPPVGRRGQAIAGIVISILGIAFWAVALLP
jgi:hypothetical protein